MASTIPSLATTAAWVSAQYGERLAAGGRQSGPPPEHLLPARQNEARPDPRLPVSSETERLPVQARRFSSPSTVEFLHHSGDDLLHVDPARQRAHGSAGPRASAAYENNSGIPLPKATLIDTYA